MGEVPRGRQRRHMIQQQVEENHGFKQRLQSQVAWV